MFYFLECGFFIGNVLADTELDIIHAFHPYNIMKLYLLFFIGLISSSFVLYQTYPIAHTPTSDYRLIYTGTYHCMVTHHYYHAPPGGEPTMITTVDSTCILTVSIDSSISNHVIINSSNLLTGTQSYSINNIGKIDLATTEQSFKATFKNNGIYAEEKLDITNGSNFQLLVGTRIP